MKSSEIYSPPQAELHHSLRLEQNSMKRHPSILRRYLSSLIDGLFIITLVIVSGYITDYENEISATIKLTVFLLLIFVYEPVCTSKLCTLGQKIVGIRIRTHEGNERISLISAYVRIVGKVMLGLLSFFSIPFTEEKRAIHDLMSGSVVLLKEKT